MLVYEIILSTIDGVRRTIIPQSGLIEFLRLLETSKEFKLVGTNLITDYESYDEMVQILKNS